MATYPGMEDDYLVEPRVPLRRLPMLGLGQRIMLRGVPLRSTTLAWVEQLRRPCQSPRRAPGSDS